MSLLITQSAITLNVFYWIYVLKHVTLDFSENYIMQSHSDLQTYFMIIIRHFVFICISSWFKLLLEFEMVYLRVFVWLFSVIRGEVKCSTYVCTCLKSIKTKTSPLTFILVNERFYHIFIPNLMQNLESFCTRRQSGWKEKSLEIIYTFLLRIRSCFTAT